MSKPKTQEQLDRETDKRLFKKYGVGLPWYNQQLLNQGGGCALCGSPGKTRRLHVDHDHKWTQIKVHAEKTSLGNWKAWAEYRGVFYAAVAPKKNDAVREVKSYLKRDSVRGLLCYQHNKGLQCFQDDSQLLRKAANYIAAHQGF